MTREGFGDGEALRLGEGIGAPPAQCQLGRAGRVAPPSPRRASAIVHHRLIGLFGAVPFDHGEFRGVQRRLARGCGRRGRNRRSASRRRQAASSWRIRARCGGSAAARSPPGATSSVAKAWRWASLPGEICSAAASTSTKPSRVEIAAERRERSRPRASRKGRRSAWRRALPEGERRRTPGGRGSR